ncbi:MAG: nuclear transport factor 2 family protein [Pseudomonadota bacterium]
MRYMKLRAGTTDAQCAPHSSHSLRNRKNVFSASWKTVFWPVAAAAFFAFASLASADDAKDPAAQLVQNYMEVVVQGREFDRIGEFIAEDLVQRNPNLPNGREPLRQFWEGFTETYPEVEFTVVRSISDGTMVWEHVLVQLTPEHSGVAVVDIFRVEDGLIVEHWDVVQEIPEQTASGNHMVLDE